MAAGETWAEAEGVIVRGHRVASGLAGDPRFPAGTIRPQLPLLAQQAPGLWDHLGGPPFPGTVNLRLPGRTAGIADPEYHVPDMRWTPHFPPETFFLSRAELLVEGRAYPALLYLPDPATKPDHRQPADLVELLARLIPGLGYGDRATLRYRPAALDLRGGRGSPPSPPPA